MIEHRHQVLRDPVLDDDERKRLRRFLKITADARPTASSPASTDAKGSTVPVDVYRPADEPTETTSGQASAAA